MEMTDKWNRHEIVFDEDMVAFVEVPSNPKEFFSQQCITGHFFFFLDIFLVFLRLGPSVYKNPKQ
jgi:hypothetical protein